MRLARGWARRRVASAQQRLQICLQPRRLVLDQAPHRVAVNRGLAVHENVSQRNDARQFGHIIRDLRIVCVPDADFVADGFARPRITKGGEGAGPLARSGQGLRKIWQNFHAIPGHRRALRSSGRACPKRGTRSSKPHPENRHNRAVTYCPIRRLSCRHSTTKARVILISILINQGEQVRTTQLTDVTRSMSAGEKEITQKIFRSGGCVRKAAQSVASARLTGRRGGA